MVVVVVQSHSFFYVFREFASICIRSPPFVFAFFGFLSCFPLGCRIRLHSHSLHNRGHQMLSLPNKFWVNAALRQEERKAAICHSCSFSQLFIFQSCDHDREGLVEHIYILCPGLRECKVTLKNTLIYCIASHLPSCQHTPPLPFPTFPHLHNQQEICMYQDLLIICHLQFLSLSGFLKTEEDPDS